MQRKQNNRSTEKTGLHPRNKHRSLYDFKQLVEHCAELEQFVFINEYKNKTIDFSDPNAVKALNSALLKHFYQLSYWDIPKGYLCPPIPGRADYIHYMADLLSLYNEGIIPESTAINVLDIGIGANCVYPIIGHREYGWKFVGSDIDPAAIASADEIIKVNGLSDFIECRLQQDESRIFSTIILPDDLFDLTICNPPFHTSAEAAETGSKRKVHNLGIQQKDKVILNFGGQKNELWCEGGEEGFVRRMIEESSAIPQQCFWFSSLISKKEHLPGLYYTLKNAGATEIRTIQMAQGQKISRVVAWTFLTTEQQKKWKNQRW